MFFEVLKVTYHIPITITGTTYGRGFRGHLLLLNATSSPGSYPVRCSRRADRIGQDESQRRDRRRFRQPFYESRRHRGADEEALETQAS